MNIGHIFKNIINIQSCYPKDPVICTHLVTWFEL